MAHKYLATGFDIHGGGHDLVFPHHENEITQAEAAGYVPFVNYWMHNGLLNLSGEKMSKSTGHVVDLVEGIEKYTPGAVRLFYLRTHYRKPVEFSEESLVDAKASLDRIWAFRRRVPGPVEDSPLEIGDRRLQGCNGQRFGQRRRPCGAVRPDPGRQPPPRQR